MAEIGCLGDVIFVTSPEKILTPSNDMEWSSSAKWQEHERHLGYPMLEYTGMDPDTIQMEIRLSVSLGVDPMEQISKLFRYEREGTLLPLTIGNHGYGIYKWVIKSTKRTLEWFDGNGNLIAATVSLGLKGYVK